MAVMGFPTIGKRYEKPIHWMCMQNFLKGEDTVL